MDSEWTEANALRSLLQEKDAEIDRLKERVRLGEVERSTLIKDARDIVNVIEGRAKVDNLNSNDVLIACDKLKKILST